MSWQGKLFVLLESAINHFYQIFYCISYKSHPPNKASLPVPLQHPVSSGLVYHWLNPARGLLPTSQSGQQREQSPNWNIPKGKAYSQTKQQSRAPSQEVELRSLSYGRSCGTRLLYSKRVPAPLTRWLGPLTTQIECCTGKWFSALGGIILCQINSFDFVQVKSWDLTGFEPGWKFKKSFIYV